MSDLNRGVFFFDHDGSVLPDDNLLLLDLPQDKKLVLYQYQNDEDELTIAVVDAGTCICIKNKLYLHRHIVRGIVTPFTPDEIDDLLGYIDELAN